MDLTLILFLLIGLCGLGLLVAGITVLLGLGSGLIAAGLCCLAVAQFLQKGISNG